METGLRARVSWAATAGVAVAAAELVVLALVGSGRLAPAADAGDLPWLVVWFTYSLAGCVVLERAPRSAVGWLLCGLGFVPTVGVALDQVATDSAVAASGALYLLMPPLLLVGVPAAFPDGLGRSTRRRLAFAGALVLGLTGLVTAVAPEAYDGVAEPVVLLGSAVGGLVCLSRHLVSTRRMTRPDRTQRLIFLAGFAAAVLVMTVGAAVVGLVGDSAPGAAWLQLVGLCCVPVGTAVAMLGSGLWGTDLARGRRVVHVAAVGLATVTAVGLVATLVAGLDLARFWVAVSAVLTCALLTPGLWWWWVAVGQLLYGPGRLAGSRLAELDRADDADLASLVAVALRSPAASVVRASADAPAGALLLPLGTHGHLAVHPRRIGESFTRRDREVAARMAAEISTRLEQRDLRRRLDEAQTALAQQRRREQDRLRAALHDTVGPLLVGAEMQARALHDAEPSPGVGEVYDSLRQAREAMRAVLDEGSPRALAAGLEPALRHLCARWPEPPVTLEAAITRSVGSQVETAAYQVVAEALANVAQHARASSCVVRVRTEAEDLVLEVVDDGVGIDPGRPLGVGLASMRGRAVELGGESRAEPAKPGTRVVARLPLRNGAVG